MPTREKERACSTVRLLGPSVQMMCVFLGEAAVIGGRTGRGGGETGGGGSEASLRGARAPRLGAPRGGGRALCEAERGGALSEALERLRGRNAAGRPFSSLPLGTH